MTAGQRGGNAAPGDAVLLIKGKGGFGNRILAAATGLVLAELTGRRPVIDWRDGIFLPPGINLYPLLFDAPLPCDAKRFDKATDVVPAIWSGRLGDTAGTLIDSAFPGRHSSPFVYRALSLDLARPDHPAQAAVFWSYLPKLARLRKRMSRHPRFAGRSLDDIVTELLHEHFTPNMRVRREIAGLFAGRVRPIIGVHIRHTDLKVPLAPFERALAALRLRMPEADIFLATDSAQVQAHMLARFDGVFVIDKAVADGDAGLHRPDHRDADTAFADPLREAENALIDMWGLARCDWLVHASRSTFSTLAAAIGGIPRDRQIDIDRHNPLVQAKRWFQAHA
ncbi:MAG: hypothetical protein WCY11_03280 [Novosphingobium sp.]